jgi:hypothetical protein
LGQAPEKRRDVGRAFDEIRSRLAPGICVTKTRFRLDRATSVRETAIFDHLLDGLNSGYRFLGKSEAQGYRAQEFPVNEYGATAHSLDDPSFGKRAAAEFRQNDALLWTGVLEDSEDLDLELFNAIPLENSASDAVQTRPDVLEREKSLSTDRRRSQQPGNRNQRQKFRPRTGQGLTHVSYCYPYWFETVLAEPVCD